MIVPNPLVPPVPAAPGSTPAPASNEQTVPRTESHPTLPGGRANERGVALILVLVILPLVAILMVQLNFETTIGERLANNILTNQQFKQAISARRRQTQQRLVRDLMRLGFLMERTYAPYPKWFGRAFRALDIADRLLPPLESALDAADWPQREAALAEAYEVAAERQNTLSICPPLPAKDFRYCETDSRRVVGCASKVERQRRFASWSGHLQERSLLPLRAASQHRAQGAFRGVQASLS